MRLNKVRSKNATQYYAIKSTYEKGKHSTKIVEKLGSEEYLKNKFGFTTEDECTAWAKEYIANLTEQSKKEQRKIIVEYSPTKQIPKGKQTAFNGGYLFLQKIVKELGLKKVCTKISEKYKFTFDLFAILACLIYSRVIFPSSKLSTYEHAKTYIQQPDFNLKQIYKALPFICKERDFIQAQLYKNSLALHKRDTNILYYDLTNYFCEIEEADEEGGIRQYGVSKENRPNPIVQMGLFLDGNGIPLAFDITPGNRNEQQTLKPLEQKIIKDFELSKFVVCTDAGLSSTANRKFNDIKDRAFVTTQSVKKLKKHMKDWALSNGGWEVDGKMPENIVSEDGVWDIAELNNIDLTGEEYSKLKKLTFYKSRWINEDGFSQRLLVTFSFKYRDYQVKIRGRQLERAQKAIDKNPGKIGKARQNDFKRFIKKTAVTKDGEVAKKELFYIDEKKIEEEAMFDGFYGVCTNLGGHVSDIIKINHGRWEIEESFRIMKSEFKARPMYVSEQEAIIGHFTTCFLALMIYRILEKKLEDRFTCNEIIDCLRDFNFYKVDGEGYIPNYIRSGLTDCLHDAFGFRTDYEIVTNSQMRKAF